MRNHNNRATAKSGVTIKLLGIFFLAFMLLYPAAGKVEGVSDRFNAALQQGVTVHTQANADSGESPAPEDSTPAPADTGAVVTQAPNPSAPTDAPAAPPPAADPIAQMYQAIDAQGYAYVANANDRVNVFADAMEETAMGTVGSGAMIATGYDEQRGMLYVLFDADGTEEGWIRVGNVIALEPEQVQALWEREPLVTLVDNDVTFAVETLTYRAKEDAAPTQQPQETQAEEPAQSPADAPTVSPNTQPQTPADGATAQPSSIDEWNDATESPTADVNPTVQPDETATALPDATAVPGAAQSPQPGEVTEPTETATLPSSLDELASDAPTASDTPATSETPTVTLEAPTELPTETPLPSEMPPVEISAFQLEGLSLNCVVPGGTAAADLPLPTSLTGTAMDGTTCEVPVTWVQAATGETEAQPASAAPADATAEAAALPAGYGPWTFTAQVAQGYVYNGAPVTAQVCYTTEIAAFTVDTATLQYEVAYGTAPADFPLPATLDATATDGAALTVPITWVEQPTANVAGQQPAAQAADTATADATTADAATETPAALPYGSGPWTYALQVGDGYLYNGAQITASVTYPSQAAQLVLDGVTLGFEVPRGTAPADLPLPKTLPAVSASGAQFEMPVVWVNGAATTDALQPTVESDDTADTDDATDYLAGMRYSYGPWVFTAQPAPGYTYTGEAVTAQVWYPDCTSIDTFCGISRGHLLMRFVVFEGQSLTLPAQVGAFMTDGGYKTIPISWSGSYNTNVTGTYDLAMNVGGDFSGGGSVTAEVTVIRRGE